MNSKKTKQSGFTFIEIMAVTAASGILAMLGLPMINDLKTQSAASGAQQMFADALAQARAHAVSQGEIVSVCGSSDGRVCNGDSWSNGWLIYSGSDSSISSDNIISAYQFEDTHYSLQVFDEKWQGVNKIQFDTQGFNLAQQRLAATVCVPGLDAEIDAVLVERTGRVRLSGNASDRQATTAVMGSATSSTFDQCKQA